MVRLMALGSLLEPEEYVRSVLDTTGLLTQYTDDGSDEALSRAENMLEFITAVKEYFAQNEGATMEDFLGNVALVMDTDGYEETANAVTLMTLHSAKDVYKRQQPCGRKAVTVASGERPIRPGILFGQRRQDEANACQYHCKRNRVYTGRRTD